MSAGTSAIDRINAERQRAAARIGELQRELAAIVESTIDGPDDEHDAEGSTIGYERARVQALLAHAQRVAAELETAADRATHGAYGQCERCGTGIPPERRDALPATLTCVNCAGATR